MRFINGRATTTVDGITFDFVLRDAEAPMLKALGRRSLCVSVRRGDRVLSESSMIASGSNVWLKSEAREFVKKTLEHWKNG